jgi:hypothetical protein
MLMVSSVSGIRYTVLLCAAQPKRENKTMQATLSIDDRLFEAAAKLAATDDQNKLIEIVLNEFM